MNFATQHGLRKRFEHDPLKENCPDCGGDGRRTWSQDCFHCEGRGWIYTQAAPQTDKALPEAV